MQDKPRNFCVRTAFMPLAFACIAGALLTAPTVTYAQGRSQEQHGNGGNQGRGGRGDQGHEGRGEDRHDDKHRDRDENHTRFTHSSESRHFDNGVTLRPGTRVEDRHLETFFPHHTYSYPHYIVSRESSRVVVSPFGFYVGIFPPYIERSAVVIAAPRHVYIDIPIYVRGEYRAYPDGREDYYLSRRGEDSRWKDDPDMKQSVYDLEDAFRNEDITLLAPLTDPSAKIAIFAKGRFQYAVTPDDYLDMTRDFLRNAHTSEFTAYRVHPKANGVYQVFVRHTYQDERGQNNTVYLCVVMERLHGRWTITQIDTTPAHG
jgi:hypothetical protein